MRKQLLLGGFALYTVVHSMFIFIKVKRKVDTKGMKQQETTRYSPPLDRASMYESEASMGIYVLSSRPAKGCIVMQSQRKYISKKSIE